MPEPPRCSNQKSRIPVTTVKLTQPTIGQFDNAAIRLSINAAIQPSRGSDIAETNVKPSQVSKSLSPLSSHENGVLNPGRTTFSTIFLPKTHVLGTSSSPAPFTSIIDLSPSQGTGKIALQITSALRGSSTGGIQFPTVAPSSVANSIGSAGGLAATILAPSGAGIIPSLSLTSGLLETIATFILTSESEPNHAQVSLELPPIFQPTPGTVVRYMTASRLTDSPIASGPAPITTLESMSILSLVSSLVSQPSSVLQPTQVIPSLNGAVLSSGVGLTNPTSEPIAPISTPTGVTPIPVLSSFTWELSSDVSYLLANSDGNQIRTVNGLTLAGKVEPTQLFVLLSTEPNKYGIGGIATGATIGAIACGVAMFLVARRYRNKKHQRSNLVSSASYYTYESMAGGAAWMPSGRPGQSSPGSRDTRGSGGSNGHAIRRRQISTPVPAENSLGWN